MFIYCYRQGFNYTQVAIMVRFLQACWIYQEILNFRVVIVKIWFMLR